MRNRQFKTVEQGLIEKKEFHHEVHEENEGFKEIRE